MAQWPCMEGQRVFYSEVGGGPARPYVVGRRVVTERLQVEGRPERPARADVWKGPAQPYVGGRRAEAKWPYVVGWRVVAERAAGARTSTAGGAATGAASLHRTKFESNDFFFEELLEVLWNRIGPKSSLLSKRHLPIQVENVLSDNGFYSTTSQTTKGGTS